MDSFFFFFTEYLVSISDAQKSTIFFLIGMSLLFVYSIDSELLLLLLDANFPDMTEVLLKLHVLGDSEGNVKIWP